MAKKNRRDRWQELCDLEVVNDSLPTRPSGHWAQDKLLFWSVYIDITSKAMSNHSKFRGGLVYVDLFSGPGVCEIRETKKRIPGSPLIACHSAKPFQKILLCDKSKKNIDACKLRLSKSPLIDFVEFFQGDCNLLIDEITDRIPARSLTLALIDPTGLHANFETIRKLTENHRVDLMILLPDSIDINRNVDTVYFPSIEEDSKLDLVMGPDSKWRDEYDNLQVQTETSVCRLFARIYKKQLSDHLGYSHFGERAIRNRNRSLYKLIYASKSPLGLKFWNEAVKEDSGGQQGIPGL